MLMAKDLIILRSYELRVIGGDFLLCIYQELFCPAELRFNVHELTALEDECLVKIHEVIPFPFIERAEIILQILKERAVEIRSFECIPMLVLPIKMIGYLNILHKALPPRTKVFFIYGYGKAQRPVWRIYPTPIPYCLFVKVLPLFNTNWFALDKRGEPTYWR